MILLQAFLRGVIVIAIAGLLSVILRNRSAALRHHIWATAIVVQLALLAFIPVMPSLNVPVFPAVDAFVPERPAASATPPEPAAKTQTPSAAAATPPTSSDAIARPQSREPAAAPIDWRKVALIIWAVGATFLLLRYLVGTLIMARIAQRGRRVDDGQWLSLAQRTATELQITRPVTLLWGESLAVPVTWGVLYPMILLPESAQDWSLERRRFVLVHEMAHVRRFDAMTQLISQLTVALFWFSPMIWIADWRMRVEREHACDDTVLRHGTEPTLYADELLQMVRGLVSRKTARPAFAALAMARRSEFEGRMLAILDSERARSAAGIGSGIAFALLSLVIAAPLAAVDPFEAHLPAQAVNDEARKPATSADTLFTMGIVRDSNTTAARTEAPAPHVASPTPWYKRDVCDTTRTATSTHVLVSDDDPALTEIHIKLERPGRCVMADIDGRIQFTEGEHGVANMSPGSHVRLRELKPGMDYSARIERPRNGGAIETTFLVNRVAAADNGEGRAWIARILPEVMRESGENAETRVALLLKAHGLEGALGTVAAISSPNSRKYHYVALIEARRWSTSELARLSAAAARGMRGATTDSAYVMQALPQPARATVTDIDLLEEMWSEMGSESDARVAMTAQLRTADRAMLLAIMRVASQFQSGLEASTLLMAAAPRYLAAHDKALEDAWFAATSTLTSSNERANALLTAVRFVKSNPRIKAGIINSAAGMASGTDKATVLTALATAN